MIWEIDEGDLFRYQVSHTYTAELMSLALDEDLRRASQQADVGRRAQQSNRFALGYPMMGFLIRRLGPARLGSP